ncbi:serine/threonine-protein kinase [Nocardia stercoris]|uniref:non-specific serine/threonine protein kinase n=1 Tax=Nocardia stercoris TaxID=2483361 RepID=A0A3M2LEG3_9NOCA|nr:serine/threonine-protein kinase [Nocardia stercoris]RMI35160.1 hypothetical protein EBN03_02325 [Nocardia stercoris]
MTMAGAQFGRYRLLELIGEGGMGRVYRAVDTLTNRVVALKVLHPRFAADPVSQERFRREAKAAAGLSTPHVVPIFDYGDIDGRLFICMQLLVGQGLDSLLAQTGPMPAGQAVHLVSQAAEALQAAHAAGLVHRDVKPSNLFVDPNGFVYLVDFGIAQAAGESGLTGTGGAIGTFAYMAPERFTGGVADARSDVYSLAGVLFELLTGRTPFPGAGLEQQIAGHLTQPPPRPSDSRPELGAGFDAVVAQGMAKDPARRFGSADELAAAATAALAEVAVSPQTEPGRPREPAAGGATPGRGRLLRIGVLATVVVAAVTAGVVYAMTRTSSHPATVHAQFTVADPQQPFDTKLAGLALDPAAHTAYTVDTKANVLRLYDTGTRSFTATVDVGKNPLDVALDTANHTAYVVDYDDETVSVIDTDTRAVTATFPAGSTPNAVAYDPGTHVLYVSNGGDQAVSVIDVKTRAVVKRIALDGRNYPNGIVVDSANHRVYVSYTFGPAVTVIDTESRTVTATIPAGKTASSLGLDAAAHLAYVGDSGDNTVSVIDTRSQKSLATVPVGHSPTSVAVDPAYHNVYVANANFSPVGTVSVINTESRTVVATLPIRGWPAKVVVDPGTHIVYVLDAYTGVSVVTPV